MDLFLGQASLLVHGWLGSMLEEMDMEPALFRDESELGQG